LKLFFLAKKNHTQLIHFRTCISRHKCINKIHGSWQPGFQSCGWEHALWLRIIRPYTYEMCSLRKCGWLTHNQVEKIFNSTININENFETGAANLGGKKSQWQRLKTVLIRVARFFFVHDTKTGKMYQINTQYPKCP
jgi:hypothetical protein